MKKLDLLAAICFLIEAVVAWWYFGYIWELMLILAIIPFYTLITTLLSTLIAVVVSILTWSIKMSKIIKLLKFLIFPIFRLIKILLQKLGLKLLIEKTKWFPIFLKQISLKKEEIINFTVKFWKLLKKSRKIFYSISFFPIIIIFLTFSIVLSKVMRNFIYSSFKTSLADFLIKIGLKKVSKD